MNIAFCCCSNVFLGKTLYFFFFSSQMEKPIFFYLQDIEIKIYGCVYINPRAAQEENSFLVVCLRSHLSDSSAIVQLFCLKQNSWKRETSMYQQKHGTLLPFTSLLPIRVLNIKFYTCYSMVNLCMKNFPILIRSFVSSCRFQIKPGCSLFFLNNVVPDLNLPIPFLHWGIEMTNRFIWMAATKNFVFLKYFVVLSNSSKKVIKKDVYLAVRRSGPFLTFFFYFLFLRIKKHGEVQERH